MEIGSREWRTLLEQGSEELGIPINNEHVKRFALHALELIKWNRKVNLTAITDAYDVAVKHILDSLVPSKEMETGAQLVDIGSGGGFPGIPMKILDPSLTILLVDSSRKKVNFLKHVIRITELEGIDAIHARAEDLGLNRAYSGYFDAAVCRAFSSIDHFADLARPLLKKKTGFMIAMKGNEKETSRFTDTMEDKSAADIQTKNYSLPFIHAQRTIVKITFRS